VIALALMVLMLVALTGCFKDKEPDSTDDPIPSQSQVLPPETDPPATEAPETEPPETQAPTEPSSEPTENKPNSQGVYGIVEAEKLNIRKNPDAGAEKTGYYVKGDRINIQETKNGWGRTQHGWILLEYIQLDSGVIADPENPIGSEEITSDGNTKALGKGVVTLGSLNVRTGPGTNHDAIDTVSLCQQFSYFQKSGNWVRIEKGWISLSYFYVEGTTGEGSGSGTVTGEGVNIRSGPGVNFEKVGAYNKDAKVTILAQVNGWGYTEKGWVSMSYVAMEKQTARTATVTADTLNIRKEPDVKSEKVDTYAKDTKITVLETRNGWGRTDKGWVSLDYVKFDDSTAEAPKTQKGTITATNLNIRKEPKIDSESLGGYKKGETVEILETKDGWGRTDKGWISLDYVKLDK
jgi:uncharacterized protein YgiM (DUF1202 family)